MVWLDLPIHLHYNLEEVVAVATFLNSKTGRGILLAAGLLAVVAAGEGAVLILVLLIVWACAIELFTLSGAVLFASRQGAWAALTIQGLIVVLGALSTIFVIGHHGLWLTMVAVAAVYCENAGAQIFGKRYGRTPLAPKYSPNKTLEGALYGWICGTVGAGVFLGLAAVFDRVDNWLGWAMVACVAPPLAEFGDWIESRLKRLVGVKDSGDLTRNAPWFVRFASLSPVFGRQGGALDKTDSLWLVMLAVPLVLVISWMDIVHVLWW